MIIRSFFSFFTALSFWIFILTLPPLQTGIWIDSESVIAGTYLLMGLVGVFLTLQKSPSTLPTVTTVFLLLTLVSLPVYFWTQYTTMHIFGTPTLGEGTIMWAGFTLLSLAFHKLIQENKDSILAYSCILSGIVAVGLCILNHPNFPFRVNTDWVPYAFTSFLAPMVVGFIGSMIVLPRQALFIALISFVLVYVSGNKTAYLFGAGSLFCIALLGRFPKAERIYKWLTLLTPLAIFCFVLWLPENHPQLSSLYSRKLNLLVYAHEWKDNPLSLLWGHGWSTYYEYFQKQLPELPISLFASSYWNPSWEGIDRLDFHCMHQAAESVFAVGFLGFILYMLLIKSPFCAKKPDVLKPLAFIGSMLFTALTSTWFTMPSLWPFYIFFFMVITQKGSQQKICSQFVKLFTILATAGCFYAAITVGKTFLDYEAPKNSLFRKMTKREFFPFAPRATNYALQGFHMGHEWVSLGTYLGIAPFKQKLEFLNELEKFYSPHKSSIMFDVGVIHFLSSFDKKLPTVSPEHQKQIFNFWNQINEKIITRYPKRMDLLMDYSGFLLHNHEHKKLEDLFARLNSLNPEHCAVLWMQGVYYSQNPETLSKGQTYLHKALEKGIDRWAPIPHGLKAFIQHKGPHDHAPK